MNSVKEVEAASTEDLKKELKSLYGHLQDCENVGQVFGWKNEMLGNWITKELKKRGVEINVQESTRVAVSFEN